MCGTRRMRGSCHIRARRTSRIRHRTGQRRRNVEPRVRRTRGHEGGIKSSPLTHSCRTRNRQHSLQTTHMFLPFFCLFPSPSSPLRNAFCFFLSYNWHYKFTYLRNVPTSVTVSHVDLTNPVYLCVCVCVCVYVCVCGERERERERESASVRALTSACVRARTACVYCAFVCFVMDSH